MATISYSGAYEEYRKAEERFGNGHNRKCIDGRITGCSKCVGFCNFSGHPGFLTAAQRAKHNCVGHCCNYYLPKPERINPMKQISDPAKVLFGMIREAVSDMEGLRVTRLRNVNGSWIANYVTLSNDYQLETIEKIVKQQSGFNFRFQRLNLDFDTCVQIVMGV